MHKLKSLAQRDQNATPATPVIAYHEIVADDCSYIYGTTSGTFEEHLKLFNGGRYGQDKRGRVPLITFDDGHVSHFQHALPLLEKYGLKAVFFVTAGWIEAEPNYMNKAQLRELVSLGHRVCAHGWSHKMLTHCNPSQLWEELHHSKRVLENVLGIPVDSVSIPHGRWNKRVLTVCANAGYQDVYTSDSHIRSVRKSGVRFVGRLMVTRRLTTRALCEFLEGKTNSGLPMAKTMMKRVLRAALGDERYRKVWLLLGSKDQGLPSHVLPADRPARVLQLISSGGFYGAENMVLNLAHALPANNCSSVVCAFRNSRNPHTEIVERAQREGLQTEIVTCSDRLDLQAIRQVRSLIYKHGIDIVHTHGFKAQFYGAMAALGLSVRLVATYHSEQCDRGLRLRCYYLLNRLLLFRFSKVVAVSERIEQSLQHSGVPGNKLISIGNGIDINAFLPQVIGARRRAQRRSGAMIGLVGRLIPGKGHAYLLRSAKRILQHFPETRFLFVGNGPELSNLQNLVRSLSLEKQVLFRGHQQNMPAAYAEMDLVVLPSLTEGLPMTLIEAMAARLPVLATQVGDIPKLVIDGETGLLIPPNDVPALENALLHFLSNPEWSAKLAANGHRLVKERFCAEKMAQGYAATYSQFVSRSQRLTGSSTESIGNLSRT